MTAIALTIAGSDSSGGAGIQADLKTFAALGVYGASAITALTAQNTQGVDAVLVVPPDFVARQIRVVVRDLDVARRQDRHAGDQRDRRGRRRATRGITGRPRGARPGHGRGLWRSRCSMKMPSRRCARVLLPRAALITPNLPEAAKLLGASEAKDEAQMRAQAEALRGLGARAVLIKGGHAEGPDAVDILADGEGVLPLLAPRVATSNTHGTGCTLSSAIAAELAKGASLRQAVTSAKAYVTAALQHAGELADRQGQGPRPPFPRALACGG